MLPGCYHHHLVLWPWLLRQPQCHLSLRLIKKKPHLSLSEELCERYVIYFYKFVLSNVVVWTCEPFPLHWHPISLLHWAEFMTCGTLKKGHVVIRRLHKIRTDIVVCTFIQYFLKHFPENFVQPITAFKTNKHFPALLSMYHPLKELHELTVGKLSVVRNISWEYNVCPIEFFPLASVNKIWSCMT